MPEIYKSTYFECTKYQGTHYTVFMEFIYTQHHFCLCKIQAFHFVTITQQEVLMKTTTHYDFPLPYLTNQKMSVSYL
jgi:hypothetical protein